MERNSTISEVAGWEINITPQMIAAGVDAWAEFFADLKHAEPGAKEAMVQAVFRAMVSASSHSHVVRK